MWSTSGATYQQSASFFTTNFSISYQFTTSISLKISVNSTISTKQAESVSSIMGVLTPISKRESKLISMQLISLPPSGPQKRVRADVEAHTSSTPAAGQSKCDRSYCAGAEVGRKVLDQSVFFDKRYSMDRWYDQCPKEEPWKPWADTLKTNL